MKTIIIYGSRKGCTNYCARKMSETGINIQVKSITEIKDVNLHDFSTVVLGSSIWGGKIHRKMAKWIGRNKELLLSKKLGLFLCSGGESESYFSKNFPVEILTHSIKNSFLGGKLNLQDFGPLLRYVLKMKAGITESYVRVKETEIPIFINGIQKMNYPMNKSS